MKRLKKAIIQVLIVHPDSRDSDELLYGWLMIEKGTRVADMKGSELLKGMSDGMYPSFDTVSRCRRLIQAQHEDLRGLSYAKRHRLQENVKAELRAL